MNTSIQFDSQLSQNISSIETVKKELDPRITPIPSIESLDGFFFPTKTHNNNKKRSWRIPGEVHTLLKLDSPFPKKEVKLISERLNLVESILADSSDEEELSECSFEEEEEAVRLANQRNAPKRIIIIPIKNGPGINFQVIRANQNVNESFAQNETETSLRFNSNDEIQGDLGLVRENRKKINCNFSIPLKRRANLIEDTRKRAKSFDLDKDVKVQNPMEFYQF